MGVSCSRTLSDHNSGRNCSEAVTTIQWPVMADLTEIEALKASLRGAHTAVAALAGVAARIEAADAHADVAEADLDELQRLALANAVAAQALRGFVESMLKRRGKIAAVSVESGSGGIEE